MSRLEETLRALVSQRTERERAMVAEAFESLTTLEPDTVELVPGRDTGKDYEYSAWGGVPTYRPFYATWKVTLDEDVFYAEADADTVTFVYSLPDSREVKDVEDLDDLIAIVLKEEE